MAAWITINSLIWMWDCVTNRSEVAMIWCAITFDQRVLVEKYYGLNSVHRFSGKKQRERIKRWKCCLYGRVYQTFRELLAVERHPWLEDAITPWSIPHFSHLTDCKLSVVFVFTSVIFIQLTYVSLYSISSGVFFIMDLLSRFYLL